MLATPHDDPLDAFAFIGLGVALTLIMIAIYHFTGWVASRVDAHLDRRAASAEKAVDGTRTFAADWIPQVEDVAGTLLAIDILMGRVK